MGLGAGLLKIMGRDPTLTDRTQIWDLLLALTTNTWFGTWFGTGFENFWLGPRLDKIWSMYRWGPAQAHNGYIEIFLNLGWIGIALLAVILLIGYRTVIAGLRRSPSTGSLMLAYFVVGIVYNFTEAAFFRISAPVWFALLLVITKVPIVVDTAPDLLRHSFRSRSRVPGPRHRLQPIRS
jgi:O-antigen ligase